MFGQDEIFGRTPDPVPQPPTVEARRSQCQRFCLRSHEVSAAVLSSLDISLGLPKGTLISLCPMDKPSATGVRLLRADPSSLHEKQTVSAGAHTDIGVLTLVFNVVGGLQIRPAKNPDSREDPWKFIRPQQGCVVVNVGDTLVHWTGGVLRSSLHRIHKPPGKQGVVPRISLVYPLRPTRDGSMQRLKGSNMIPALADGEKDETRSTDDWAAWKAQQIRDGEFKAQTIGGISMDHMPSQVAV